MNAETRPTNASDFHYVQGGGTLGPSDLFQFFSRREQKPAEWKGERFELVDASGAVTEQARTPYEIKKKADKLGITRYLHTDLHGKRVLFEKRDGSWLPSAEPAPAPREAAPPPPPAPVTPLEASLAQRYAIGPAQVSMDELSGQTEYRFRGDSSRVAFTEGSLRVTTEINSPSAVRSMIDVAELRGWPPLRLEGHVDFKRMAWLEASIRGLAVMGYQPTRGDAEVLKHEREERLIARDDTGRAASHDAPARVAMPGAKLSTRSASGRPTVLAAIEAVLVSRKVPDALRKAVLEAATNKLAQRSRAPLASRVKAFDQTAPLQRPAVAPIAEVQSARERAAPAR